jgi:hypothetical protein
VPAAILAAQLEQLQQANLRRDHDAVREMLFTAGSVSELESYDGHSAPAMDTDFDWPALEDARSDLERNGAGLSRNGADFERNGAVSARVGHPDSDADQVSA